MAPNLPLTVQPVTVPPWFQSAAKHLPPGQVLATYPFATANSQASIPWQAIGGMHYKMAGGGGPTGTVSRAGANRAGFAVLSAASVPVGPPPTPSEVNLEAVRHAMRDFGVTMVVVPDGQGLPAFQIGRGSGYGVAFYTAVLGSAPRSQDGAWVWTNVGEAPAPVGHVTANTLADCAKRGTLEGAGRSLVAHCVLTAAAGSAHG
jgi:hypothetical protein